MSHLKWFLFVLLSTLVAQSAFSDINRTFYSLENRFPRWEQIETGIEYRGVERNSDSDLSDIRDASLYVRYGILDNFAVRFDVPYREVDPPFSESESGLGDMELEFQLRAYEDIFGYPYFLPYFNFSLPTGDEDKGLGVDDFIFTGGVSYGGKIHDWIAWVFDFSYKVNPDTDNQFRVANSYVWEYSEEFALLTEVYFEQENTSGEDDSVVGSLGFIYNWTPDMQLGISVGGGFSGPTDVEGNFRLSYSF